VIKTVLSVGREEEDERGESSKGNPLINLQKQAKHEKVNDAGVRPKIKKGGGMNHTIKKRGSAGWGAHKKKKKTQHPHTPTTTKPHHPPQHTKPPQKKKNQKQTTPHKKNTIQTTKKRSKPLKPKVKINLLPNDT